MNTCVLLLWWFVESRFKKFCVEPCNVQEALLVGEIRIAFPLQLFPCFELLSKSAL